MLLPNSTLLMKNFTHLNSQNSPTMVDVGDKKATQRIAKARSLVVVSDEILQLLNGEEILSKKGPVFQTAIIAGIQGVKKTSELIPMCHPLLINGVDIDIKITDLENIEVLCKVTITGKTGVEMEALTGANITCLTIYDMCKAVDKGMEISQIRLMEKTGGRSGQYVYESE